MQKASMPHRHDSVCDRPRACDDTETDCHRVFLRSKVTRCWLQSLSMILPLIWQKNPKWGHFGPPMVRTVHLGVPSGSRVAAYGVHHRLRGEGTVGLGAKFGRAG